MIIIIIPKIIAIIYASEKIVLEIMSLVIFKLFPLLFRKMFFLQLLPAGLLQKVLFNRKTKVNIYFAKYTLRTNVCPITIQQKCRISINQKS